MYQLKFTLKQHTPIIHFQHDQVGATLRATEVKPKLDRFIIEKLTGKKGQSAIEDFKNKTTKKIRQDNEWVDNPELNEKWLNMLIGKSNEKLALDYKLKIEPSLNCSFYLPLPMKFSSKNYPTRDNKLVSKITTTLNIKAEILAPTLYFANADKVKFQKNGDKNEIDINQSKLKDLSFAIITDVEICASITCFNKLLEDEIENDLAEFFLLHNFGTRQNKGFGSFTVEKVNGMPPKGITKPDTTLFMYKSISSRKDLSEISKFIKDEYQLLKSGASQPSYEKSKLFDYYVNKISPPLRWEKRYIKQKINSSPIDSKLLYKRTFAPIDIDAKTKKSYNNFRDHQTNTYKFIRALLGLAEQYEFLVFNDTNTAIDFGNKYIISISHQPTANKEKIERFQSPLFFKVIDGNVYLRPDDSFKQLENENFEFKVKLKTSADDPVSIGRLDVPQNFDIKDFLQKELSGNWTNMF